MKPNVRLAFYEPFGSGGICHYTYQLAEKLATIGVDVTVFTTEDYELEDLSRRFKINRQLERTQLKRLLRNALTRIRPHTSASGPPMQSQHQHGSPASKSLLALRRWIIWTELCVTFLLQRPHIIHFQWLLNAKEDYHFIRLLKAAGFRLVYTAHNLLPHDSTLLRDRDAFRRVYEVVDKVIVHSHANMRQIVSEFGLPSSRMTVIPLGSFDLFNADKGLVKGFARSRLGIPNDKRVILFFGSIRRYKGVEYLVEAFQEVKRKASNAVLLIAGKVNDADDNGLGYYSHWIRQVAVHKDVICVPHYIPFQDVGYFFAAADVVVLPYTKTYQSGVLLSAYAAGRAVIVTDTGGLAEVVESGRSGFVVPPEDSGALARAITEIIENPDQLEEMGRYAKYLSEGKYSWHDIAIRTWALYQSLVGRTDPVKD